MTADPRTILANGAGDIVPPGGLEAKLALGRPLRVKFGVDPSRPDLTLGHAVVLRKLRQFQDLGHVAVLIIGDFTGMVGDPSGRSETRPTLTPEEMAENARTYFDQARLVLDMEAAEVRWNSEWLGAMDMQELLRLASSATVAQMLDREDFRARYDAAKPISIVEFLYPLLQARDSVAVEADIELGGSDQLFNLLMGREIQREWGMEPQVVLTMPLLEGTDGVRKMSKSYDNYVALTDEPDEMFGRLMRIPDALIPKYLRLCTDEAPDLVNVTDEGLAAGTLRPNQEKRRMARLVVDLYHGAGSGESAEARFDQVFSKRQLPAEIEERPIPADAIEGGKVWLPKLLVGLSLAASNGEARRAVAQGGVRLDGEPLSDPEAQFDPAELAGRVLQVGRRRFVRIASV